MNNSITIDSILMTIIWWLYGVQDIENISDLRGSYDDKIKICRKRIHFTPILKHHAK